MKSALLKIRFLPPIANSDMKTPPFVYVTEIRIFN